MVDGQSSDQHAGGVEHSQTLEFEGSQNEIVAEPPGVFVTLVFVEVKALHCSVSVSNKQNLVFLMYY